MKITTPEKPVDELGVKTQKEADELLAEIDKQANAGSVMTIQGETVLCYRIGSPYHPEKQRFYIHDELRGNDGRTYDWIRPPHPQSAELELIMMICAIRDFLDP